MRDWIHSIITALLFTVLFALIFSLSAWSISWLTAAGFMPTMGRILLMVVFASVLASAKEDKP